MTKGENMTISREIIRELVELVYSANLESKRYRYEACIGESITHKKQRVAVVIEDDLNPLAESIIYNEIFYTTAEVAEGIDAIRSYIAKDKGGSA